MDKYQLVLIEIEIALNKVITFGLDNLDTYTRPRKTKQKSKDGQENDQEEFPFVVVRTADVSNFIRQSDRYASIDELENLSSRISECSAFMRRHLDDNNLAISNAAREMYPLVTRLKSLMHIARAHPDSALKRAKNILQTSHK
jgi:Trm5-related predicted tRNA methylase